MQDVLATTVEIDTHEMVVIHRAFRRESRLLGVLIASVPDGHTERAAVLSRHLGWYQAGLANHHHGEDELLWPLLRERAHVGAEIVVRMERQHTRVAETLEEVLGALPAWQASAGANGRNELVRALSAHHQVLIEHLDDEEQHLLPLAARHLTDAEWAALGDHFVAATPKAELLLFLGAVLEETTADERTALLGAMPIVARFAWLSVGRRRYTSHVRQVRGNYTNQSHPMSAINSTEV